MTWAGLVRCLRLAVCLSLLGLLPAKAADLALHVTPQQRLVTDPARVVLGGVPAGAQVVIEATMTDKSGQVWSSRGVYFARHDGLVDTAVAASLSGTYTGVDPEGLFWSMLPVAVDALETASIANRKDDWPSFPDFDSWNAPYKIRKDPVTVSFTARLGGALSGSTPAAEASQKVMFIADGVKRVAVSKGDLRGVLYEAAGKGPHPLAMVVTGSGGGVNEGKAALLASHGITALALAHFNYPGRPKQLLDIPLEYFSKAMTWLAGKYGQERVAIIGGSRGGEGVLLIGSTFPEQVSAVVAEVPSNVVFAGCCNDDGSPGPAWTFKGKDLPYFTWEAPELQVSDIWAPTLTTRELFRPGITQAAFNDPRFIPTERIKAPILLVSGDADGLWASDVAAQRVLERLKANGFVYPAKHINYPGASHIVSMPMLVKSLADRVRSAQYGYLAMGGTPKANAHAQTDAFQQTVRFLKQHEAADD